MFLKALIIGLFVRTTHSVTSRCFYLPNIALIGGTYDEFNANDIKRCCIACARDHCCLGYTYSKTRKRCYLKSAVSNSEINYETISGLKANTHSGQGSILKNVKIEGGATAAVLFRKPEECQQYCTDLAYGIYSWSPPTPGEDGEGHCVCMTRIQSLQYSYGSRSAIFPPVASIS
uniref:Bm4198 n=1 Tax=Brugia malayi TaxID=6279 RepID=A0A7I4KH50_BRUMA